MQIMIRIKALGKKRDIPAPTPYDIDGVPATLRELITELVSSEVDRYNAPAANGLPASGSIPAPASTSSSANGFAGLLPYLTAEQIDDAAAVGKVGFGRMSLDDDSDENGAARFSAKAARRDEAIETALQAFNDGLVRVVMTSAALPVSAAPTTSTASPTSTSPVTSDATADAQAAAFVDLELTDLDAPLTIPADAIFTFMRLAFLAGRMW